MELETPLWQFSVRFYTRSNVSDVLLTLQEEFNCSINQLLFACWLASKNRLIVQLAVDDDSAAKWQRQVTTQLRHIRHWVKQQKIERSELEECYNKLLVAELAAEQVELAIYYKKMAALSRSQNEEDVGELLSKNLSFCVSGKEDVERDLLLRQLNADCLEMLYELSYVN